MARVLSKAPTAGKLADTGLPAERKRLTGREEHSGGGCEEQTGCAQAQGRSDHATTASHGGGHESGFERDARKLECGKHVSVRYVSAKCCEEYRYMVFARRVIAYGGRRTSKKSTSHQLGSKHTDWEPREPVFVVVRMY